MPVTKQHLPGPGHEHPDGDYGLAELQFLRIHLRAGHAITSGIAGKPRAELTARHQQLHGLTPVTGAPASAEELAVQIQGLVPAADPSPPPSHASWVPSPGYAPGGLNLEFPSSAIAPFSNHAADLDYGQPSFPQGSVQGIRRLQWQKGTKPPQVTDLEPGE